MIYDREVDDLVSSYLDDLVLVRRWLHAHPELSFHEYNTSAFIKEKLDEWGISYTSDWGGGTGIVGVVGRGEPCIALRADIDALPINELNDAPYKSQHSGLMHACGHDVHTTCLLGAARILKHYESSLKGTVKLIFQPGEEKLPGGASLMIKEGVLTHPDVSKIFGLHVHPELEVGQIGYFAGHFMASADELFITVHGKGGHGAMPHLAIDPIFIGAQLVLALQSISSRKSSALIPTILSIGKFQSDGGATNIIPSTVRMEGTFRTFDDEWRLKAHDLIKELVTHTANAHGASIELDLKVGYPSLYNDPELVANVVDALCTHLGKDHVVQLAPRMTSEDFAFYSKECSACFLRLGTGSADGRFRHSVHTPYFDIDEAALYYGVKTLIVAAFSAL